jgi:hypothetical protein
MAAGTVVVVVGVVVGAVVELDVEVELLGVVVVDVDAGTVVVDVDAGTVVVDVDAGTVVVEDSTVDVAVDVELEIVLVLRVVGPDGPHATTTAASAKADDRLIR